MTDSANSSSTRGFFRRHRVTILAVQALIFLGIGYLLARGIGGPAGPKPEAQGEKATSAKSKEGPTMWTCSMHPQIREPKPGKCRLCGMDLIPVQPSTGGLRTLAVSPETRALLNVDSTPVERRYVSHEIAMVGKVDYDETRLGYITAWVPGRLDRLYVNFPGVRVNQGDHMVYVYSPELYSAQEELIQALKYQKERSKTTRAIPTLDLAEAARDKLRLLGLAEDQIKLIEKQDKPTDHLTIPAPVGGIVIEKLKQEGDYVKTGERIYTIADLNQVWVHLDAYESDEPWIRYGQDLTITTEAYPGEEIHGRIAFIQPVLNDKTRTVKVRVNVPNPDGKLKPDMFVHAIIHPTVAAGGRVMDPDLAGKWISPMHPEIVKDEPGTCDICGMPLVRAESLGYVTPETDDKQAPLVIPYSAALVTGRRAIVYVELPTIPQGVETAFQGVGQAIENDDLAVVHRTFAVFSNVLDRPYDENGTIYARRLWNDYADRLAVPVLAGKRAKTLKEADDDYGRLEKIMEELREQFAPLTQPTFEGREIVLGPRAGDFYLVRNGLQEGELVVTQGNFKIDAEIQIKAKPSMMTPGGGGGGGHHHGGEEAPHKSGSGGHAGHMMASLPPSFKNQLHDLVAAYEQVSQAIDADVAGRVAAAFDKFGQTLKTVDGSQLNGHPRMLWKEFAMLLSNDAVEGRDVKEMADADRVYLLLKGHMRRLRDEMGVHPDEQKEVEHIEVSPEFQDDLAAVWQNYLAIQSELSNDDYKHARELLETFETAVATVNGSKLDDHAKQVWQREHANLTKLIAALRQSADIKAMRTEFKPLSEEIGVLAKSFGFGHEHTIFELHCPMAFQNKGAIWYQDSESARNPYYGSSMLKCADRVERIVHDTLDAAPNTDDAHSDHSHH